MIVSRIAAVLLALVLASAAAAAPPQHRQQAPLFIRYLYPPELVMRHQREIGLSDDQRQRITKLVRETQSRILELRWDLSEASEALEREVREERVNEQAALTAADRVMKKEHQVKREHLRLLIRIKSILTPAQQQQLGELRGPRR